MAAQAYRCTTRDDKKTTEKNVHTYRTKGGGGLYGTQTFKPEQHSLTHSGTITGNVISATDFRGAGDAPAYLQKDVGRIQVAMANAFGMNVCHSGCNILQC